MKVKRYENLIWPEVEEELQNNMLIIPVGSIEQHGPHLPLGVDGFLADKISEELARETGAIIAPKITYGGRSLPNSGGGLSYPGTVYINGDVLMAYYFEILHTYIAAGAKKILILNGHWENEAFLFESVEKCRQYGDLKEVKIIVTSWWSVVSETEMIDIFSCFSGWHVEHAGQAETALMSYYMPGNVKLKNAVDCQDIIPSGIYKYPTPRKWSGNMGVLSKTLHVNSEMGKRLAQVIKKNLLILIEDDW